jgi:hypothetical protein
MTHDGGNCFLVSVARAHYCVRFYVARYSASAVDSSRSMAPSTLVGSALSMKGKKR